ncbi:serine carboxypeptidase-like protein [Tanacetum coccineum]
MELATDTNKSQISNILASFLASPLSLDVAMYVDVAIQVRHLETHVRMSQSKSRVVDDVARLVALLPYLRCQASNLLSVDQPIRTGFSYTSDKRDICHDEQGISDDLYDFLQVSLLTHCSLMPSSKSILNMQRMTSSSPENHMLDIIFLLLLLESTKETKLRKESTLTSRFAIGNGLTDPLVQYKAYTNYALYMGIGDNHEHYDIRKHCEDSLCYYFSNMEDLLSKQYVTEALGVVDIDFFLRSPVVYQAMIMDMMRNLEAGIPYLYLKMGLSCSYMQDSMTLSATGLVTEDGFMQWNGVVRKRLVQLLMFLSKLMVLKLVMDIMDSLFVDMFDKINVECRESLEAIRKQFPFKDLKSYPCNMIFFIQYVVCLLVFGNAFDITDVIRPNPGVREAAILCIETKPDPQEILLKMNLPDHRSVLTDPEDQAKMEMETPRSSGVNSPPNAHT